MANRGNALMLLASSLSVGLGCGARTGTLFDDGAGAFSAGAGGFGGSSDAGSGAGGAHATGGSDTGGSPSSSQGGLATGGSFNAGGSGVGGMVTGGSFSAGGSGVGGLVTGGSFSAGGSSFGGLGNTGGVSVGGFGAVGGEVGSGGSGTIVEACVASARTACDKCLCRSCGSELNSCFSDPGCTVIFACVEQTQCQGLACYQTCRTVINQFGGLTGAAVSEVFSLASCAITTQAVCGCN